MDESFDLEVPRIPSRTERADAVAKALSEAARRTRLSKKNKRHLSTDQYRGRRDEKLLRLIRRVSLVVLFLIPSFAVTVYYSFIASDQYVAEARFTVRGGAPPQLDTIGALTGLPPALIMQDTQVILNYILSRAMVEKLEQSAEFRQSYSKPSIDALSRMNASASIEKVLKYWKSMVDTSVRMPAGIVVLKLRAYAPADAVRIANGMLAACEELVNEMNDRMIRDTLAVSQAERERAEASLIAARARLESSRNSEGLLNADVTADVLNGFVAKLRGQLGHMQQEYNAQRRYVADDAPQLRDLDVRIEAANEEVKALQAHLTGSESQNGSAPLTKAMSNLDYLNLENTIAEKIYASSLALLEQARLASEAKLLYLNVFVRPELAEEADHVQHRHAIILFVLADFAAWVIFTLIFGFLYKNGFLRLPSLRA
jgi:capsular polysaccharide transport system permease protein